MIKTMDSADRASAPPLPAVQRYFEISLYLLVATGILAIVITGKLDLFTTLAAPLALAYKGVRVWRGRGPELSARAATWLVLAYFLFFPIDMWGVSRSMSVGAPNPMLYSALLATIHLLLFAVIVRMFSARTSRDHGFLAVLAFTCMLASAILTVEASFLVLLAIFLLLAVSTFVALEIRRSATGAVSPPIETGSPLAQQLEKALGAVSGFVAVGTLALGAILFFLIPRWTAGYMGAINLQPSLATGFTDNVTLGEIGKIQQNKAVVMRIRVDGDPERAEDIHWRGIVLTNFDGKRWFTPAQELDVLAPGTDGAYNFEQAFPLPGKSFRLRYTALAEPMGTNAIFVAPRPERIAGRFSSSEARPVPGGRTFGYLLIDKTGSLFNPFHNEIKTRYEGVSDVPLVPPNDLRHSSSEYPDAIRGVYLQLPPLDPRIKKLADEMTAGSKNAYDKAANVERILKTRYAYTLDLSGPPAADPMANFLFKKKAGNCEYFASAMTVLLRAEGIPTRYVTGFLPGEYNEIGGDYIVRASDAHAWVEVFFPAYGWITFDPTPPANDAPSGLLGKLSLYWDWFQFTWSEWVINYDFGHQISLAQDLQRSSRDWSARAQRQYEAARDRTLAFMLALDNRLESSRYFLPSLLAFLVLVLLYLRGREVLSHLVLRWGLMAHRRGNVDASLAALEYREMLRLLEKRGWKKSPSQTAQEFAAAIPAAEFSGPVADLTELYQSSRFGDHPARADQMSSLLASIRELARTVKRPKG